MTVELAPAASTLKNDENGSRVLQNPPLFPEENAGFATKSGAWDGGFVAKPSKSAEIATLGERLTAIVAAVDDGQVQQVLALAVRSDGPVTIAVGGRPEALGRLERQKILLMLKMGFSRALAAAEIGVHRSTITRTMARAPEFRADVLHAEQLAERAPLLCVLSAAQRDWRAAAWLLKQNEAQSVKNRKRRERERKSMQDTARWFKDTKVMLEETRKPEPEPPLDPPRKPRGGGKRGK